MPHSPGQAGVGRLSTIVLDCPDPSVLAGFYSTLIGWPVDDEATDDDWVELAADGGVRLAFQLVPGYQAPQWPGQSQPQQAHLDVAVADLDEGERQVLALGAVRHPVQPGESFRVYLDPAGHPFCLVRG